MLTFLKTPMFFTKPIATFLTLLKVFCTLILIWPTYLSAQWKAPAHWQSEWVTAPNISAEEQNLLYFRKSFTLQQLPEKLNIYLSADNRYKCYLNGKLIGIGPARSTVNHWKIDSLNLRPNLKSGENVLAIMVWNYGPKLRPFAQLGFSTKLWIAQDAKPIVNLSTTSPWKVFHNNKFTFLAHKENSGYYVASPAEIHSDEGYPEGWLFPNFNIISWADAVEAEKPLFLGAIKSNTKADSVRLILEPANLPQMLYQPIKAGRVVASYGAQQPPKGFPETERPFTIPARSNFDILIDHGAYTTAYIRLKTSGGKGSIISATGVEALYEGAKFEKGDRSKIGGKRVEGLTDQFLISNGQPFEWETLWWRAFRYMRLQGTTGEQPLTLQSINYVHSTFPFNKKAEFNTPSDTSLGRMMAIGWRTAQACANETYMDCPYYEQLQYIGDTRIQALLSIYMAADARLFKNALYQLQDNLTKEGLTGSRNPSAEHQRIPGFSLWWCGMLYDYFRYVPDVKVITDLLPTTHKILDYFRKLKGSDGLLGQVPHWNYIDWFAGRKFSRGVPFYDSKKRTFANDLQYLLALQYVAEMEGALGSAAKAVELQKEAENLRITLKDIAFPNGAKYVASNADNVGPLMQHNQAMAVLAGIVPEDQQADLMRRTMTDTALVKTSIYFSYYLHEALWKAGLGNDYLKSLDIWRGQMKLNLTTWAEAHEPARSDCHAWGSSPNINFLKYILGVDADDYGFGKVVIRPHLNGLKQVTGTIPHFQGDIKINYQQKGKTLSAEILIPEGLPARFQLGKFEKTLSAGLNKFQVPL